MKPVTVLDRCSVHYMLFIFLFNAFLFPCCSARDTITIDSPVAGKDTLVSAGERYVLGFLSPASTSYIGIWHRLDPSIVVWVANRDKAFTYTGGAVLAIENGNLSVTDAEGMSYWSRGPGSSVSPNITAQLLDSGNLVLREAKEGTRTILWQSFTEPTDTFLPGMNMDENLQLVSWKDTNDPTPGYFTFKTGEEGKGYVIQIHSDPYWMSNGFFPSDDKISVVLSHPPFNSSQILRNISIFPGKYNTDQRLVLNSSGEIQNWSWDDKSLWTLNAKEPKDFCSVYNACGNNSICKMNWDSTPSCACLEGFMPVSIENWESGSVASGCTAKQFACQNHIFRNYTKVRVGKPDLNKPVENEAVCSNECDCHCQAYSYEAPIKQFAETNQQSGNPDSGGTCWLWRGGLINFQEEYRGGCNLSVRVTVSDKGRGPSSLEPKSSSGSLEPKLNVVSRRSNHLTLTIFMTVISVSVFSCAAIVYIWRRYVRKPDVAIQRNPMIHRFDSERHAKDLIETSEFNDEDKRGIDVPFFEFESIVSATDNFSNANKLGQGGYGPVYKGMFPGGQELAVKRLSSVSRQGLQEFKNEVVLIAKLQHRNLVKLWGYCVKGDEKILIYEYMPNRSLDAFIFGSTLPALDWEMRYNIILGIARGLLYLHQDSRLRIIHRDMKTSNILLDGEMNPKISDFGLARIVGGKQNEANTNRVVGTYGYMAPEYALEGLFSVKSDVFSFGVVMLEIICGKRNTGFYGSQEALSLLGYCWRFWEEDDVWKLMDQTLGPSCNRIEFVKCAHIGLLCVQEEAKDRPDMETVIMMIGSESATLPRPKQPAFIERAGPSSSGIDSSSVGTGSNTHTCCDLTNTSVEGR